jgi:hypothetical protein
MCKFGCEAEPAAAIRCLGAQSTDGPRNTPNGEGYHSAMNRKSIHGHAGLSPGFHPAGEDLPEGAPDCGAYVNWWVQLRRMLTNGNAGIAPCVRVRAWMPARRPVYHPTDHSAQDG